VEIVPNSRLHEFPLLLHEELDQQQLLVPSNDGELHSAANENGSSGVAK
jgi:hypothetical protein